MTPRTVRASYAWSLAIAALAALAWWGTRGSLSEPTVLRAQPVAVMGTDSTLVAILPAGRGSASLGSAEAELRRLETLFSGWIETSEVSILNRAPAYDPIELPAEVLEVLTAASRLHGETEGAFDVTAGPLIERWRRAGEEGVLPTVEELAEARRASSWLDFEVGPREVVKSRDSARVDLDGLAKGYAIDRALDALLGAGAIGGMVEVGGDLRVAGPGPDGGAWSVGVRSPFEDRAWGNLALRNAAACTSGPYHRWIEIGSRRYSHILDPRTLRPAKAAVSTTVIGPDALMADGWATALSVLGSAGLALLPENLEALIVLGSASDYRTVATPGFAELFEAPELEIEIFDR